MLDPATSIQISSSALLLRLPILADVVLSSVHQYLLPDLRDDSRSNPLFTFFSRPEFSIGSGQPSQRFCHWSSVDMLPA